VPTDIRCAWCGAKITGTIVRYQLEQFDLISHAEAHGRWLPTDAAVTCSTNCLSRYLEAEMEGA
jgi:hypothetical protein